jgi:hypothetical protein
MADKQAMLDAFSVLRGTWDDLVSMQPDIVAASGPFTALDFAELRARAEAHKEALDRFVASIRNGASL